MVAVAARPWVAVVGAGLSGPDISSWSRLCEALAKELEGQAAFSDNNPTRFAPVISKIENPNLGYWEKFGILKEAIPVAYRNIIRQEFGKSDSNAVPAPYSALWALPLRGILSLNLDAFARRAARMAGDDGEIKIFEGHKAGKLQRMLGTHHRFLYQLHGHFDDEESWVFTQGELKELYSSPGYLGFLRTVFTQFHVVFVGVSADDIAIGGPLEELAKAGIQGPEHFWITDRTDEEAVRWADAAMVERVIYTRGKHEQVLDMLRALGKAKPDEPSATPVAREYAKYRDHIESPDMLARLQTDQIRERLNGYAKFLLTRSDLDSYNDFLHEYDELIDRSWYIPPKPIDYKIFDYTITDYSAKGAFGSVYRAVDPTGHEIALKLLKREIRGDAASIHAFRRGVKAMKILESRKVAGMVAYRDASEIPTFVTMDWVEGPNLQAAKEAHLVEDWQAILDVFIKATAIINEAHRLPEKVLHRDIRPANIMLRDAWSSRDVFEVVVLDFDLATYSGAKTESVIAEGSALGYLAPEQFKSDTGSRSALVDSFGLGMTLYYLAGRQEPNPYFQRDGNFKYLVRRATRVPEAPFYRATARRVERLIVNSTHEAQRDRWSVDLILAEAKRIQEANSVRSTPLDGDLAAEEIAARSPLISDGYAWDYTRDAATYSVASGPTVRIQGAANSFDVSLKIEWADDGTLSRKGVEKYLPDRLANAGMLLSKAGWRDVKKRSVQRQATLHASLRVEPDTDYTEIGGAVGAALEALTFS
ncbi:protein kinase domain-containing protein [Georgenia faecalis]|uniref:non-specific serine/threonine protein kinase n=1 Tax=Georgenia faecalis TaxID=2483799 RepID=A0ABV9DD52_9MICO|nr:SIR2 family protein [Georgenia faecalis]